ncbi:hypothetical protein P7K49_037371 [Saguinus oedipus]|uniref:Ig-like domain-containing protein n=1 Tax=Saguinus oedipus TaxID=9490 RepID=A0ABQ9TIQ9_SAGOE|nr:hypothetical protein P7K49_037371 [Saguinus oedipus]
MAGPCSILPAPWPPPPQSLSKVQSCLLAPCPAWGGVKAVREVVGRGWATGGHRVQAVRAVPIGCAAGSELAFVQEPGDMVAVWGHPLVLPCQVEGEPPVSISWQRDGLALANDSGATLMPDGSLHLATLPSCWSLPSSAHEYHCMAQNR